MEQKEQDEIGLKRKEEMIKEGSEEKGKQIEERKEREA